MRIRHESTRNGEVDRDAPIPVGLRQRIAELDRAHPIQEVRARSYGHGYIHLEIAIAGGAATLQLNATWSNGAAPPWKERLDAHLPAMKAAAETLAARPVRVERCSAIIAAAHMGGAAFRREAAASMPVVVLSSDQNRPVVRALQAAIPSGGCAVAIPNVSGRDLRVQVKTVAEGLSIADRTITFDRDIVLPATVMNAIRGLPLDGIVEGTPFEGHGILLDKGWRNGDGKGARLSVMAQSDLLSLDDAVALVDRLRAPLGMAA